MDPVRTAMAFSVSVIPAADVLYAPAVVPVTDHGAEYVPAFLTGQQPVIAVLCTVVAHRTRLLFQTRLNLLPDCFFNDDRIEILVTKPVRFGLLSIRLCKLLFFTNSTFFFCIFTQKL